MGKRQIKICLGSSCFARGNNANLDALRKYLKQHNLEATIGFIGNLCEEKCDRGPVICIDQQVYEEVNLSRLHKILQEEFSC